MHIYNLDQESITRLQTPNLTLNHDYLCIHNIDYELIIRLEIGICPDS